MAADLFVTSLWERLGMSHGSRSHVAIHNQTHSGLNVKMIRFYVRDLGLAVAFGSTFYGLCRHIEEPDECGLPQECNVMQVS